MSEELDREVLSLVAGLIDLNAKDAMLIQRLWKDREALLEAVRLIRDWDLGHAEALSIDHVQSVLEEVLRIVGEA